MKFIMNVTLIHHAIASSVLNMNMPIIMPNTFNKVENTPQKNKLLVSLAAWKIDPDVDMIICIPTDIDNIWKTGTDGIHWPPNKMRVISLAENHSNADKGKPIKAKIRMTFSYESASLCGSS